MTLARTDTPTGHQVTLTSPLGRATTYKREHDAAATESRRSTQPTGLFATAARRTTGQKTTTLPDGTIVTVNLEADDLGGCGRKEVVEMCGDKLVECMEITPHLITTKQCETCREICRGLKQWPYQDWNHNSCRYKNRKDGLYD